MQVALEPAMPAIRPPSWTQYAKCATSGGELDHLFFPATRNDQREEAAERFCTGCCVRNLCQDLGKTRNSVGFWSGEWQ